MADSKEDEDKKEDGKISILGQTLEYPRTIPGASAVLFVCAALVWSISLFLHASREQVETFGLLIWHLDSRNQATQEKSVALYQFWTPSSLTRDALKNDPKAPAWLTRAEDYQKKVEDFGEKLRQQPGVEGYRRYEAWGQGRDSHPGLLPGWWWTVRVTNEFSLKKLSEFYRGQWENPDPIYVETLNANASFEKKASTRPHSSG